MRPPILFVLAIAFLAQMSAAQAGCGSRPGTPTNVVATPGVKPGEIAVSWTSTASEKVWWDVEMTNNSQPVPQPAGVGPATKGRGKTVTMYFQVGQGGQRCFRVKARDDAGTKGCTSEQWSNQSCATAPVTQQRGAANVEKRLKAAFEAWMTYNGFKNATFSSGNATFYPKNGSTGYGNRRGSDVEPLASLSKAITGMCVAQLVRGGDLQFSDTLKVRLPQLLASVNPSDARTQNITIAQLLRHTSGLTNNGNWTGAPANSEAAGEFLARQALAVKLATKPSYVYNNVNYALLGMIISAVVGSKYHQSYDQYCVQSLFGWHRPLPNVGLGSGTKSLGAFGGWAMSAEDYARFILHFHANPDKSVAAFQRDSLSNGYGLGVGVYARAGGKLKLNHFGDWKNPSSITVTNPAEFGSYFGLYDNEVIVVVTFDRQPTELQKSSLDTILDSAAHGD